MSSNIRNYLQTNEDLDNLYSGSSQAAKRQKWLRLLLLTFLVIVLVGGFAIMGVGIWTLQAEYGNKQLSTLISAAVYRFDSVLMITVGSAIIVITLMGFCGVYTQYKCIMGLHLGLLAFMSVMLFVAGIIGYVLISDLEDKVKEKMEGIIITHYGINIDLDSENRQITEAWDTIQRTFECCGAFGDANSSTSWALYKRSQWWSEKFNMYHTIAMYLQITAKCLQVVAEKTRILIYAWEQWRVWGLHLLDPQSP
ncbi:hypothetical protein C0Q70_16588 [Pomacea canaliculata]|uniref:Uncharacterized protein n=1 Tax=Pomacea canaliculata TaxID=400727 RepID=A0A2T7NQ70_POMCA|nr:hypothetical protein C0Q70_16588 [Pomacea canaliculata]